MATSWPPTGSLHWCRPDSRSKNTIAGRLVEPAWLWLRYKVEKRAIQGRSKRTIAGPRSRLVGPRARQMPGATYISQTPPGMVAKPPSALYKKFYFCLLTIWEDLELKLLKIFVSDFQTVSGSVRMVRLTEDMIVARTRVRKNIQTIFYILRLKAKLKEQG